MHKVRRAVLLTFMLIGTFTIFLPQTPLNIPEVKASPVWNITEDVDYITIENDYYIGKIEKTKGRLYNFFIKPYPTVDIV